MKKNVKVHFLILYIYISLLCSGCIHSGIGLEQANNFLTTINIPAVNHRAFKKWQNETSSSLETVTEESVASGSFWKLLEEQDITV